MSAPVPSAKKVRVPQSPYVPPAARGVGKVCSTSRASDNLHFEQALATSTSSAHLEKQGVEGAVGGNEALQSKANHRVRNKTAAGDGVATQRALVAGVQATAAAPAPAAAAVDGRTPAEKATTKAPGNRHPRPRTPTVKTIMPLEPATERSGLAKGKLKETQKGKAKDPVSNGDFNRSCNVPSTSSTSMFCQKSPPSKTARSREGRRKTRQAWSQYVPPGRRGGTAPEEGGQLQNLVAEASEVADAQTAKYDPRSVAGRPKVEASKTELQVTGDSNNSTIGEPVDGLASTMETTLSVSNPSTDASTPTTSKSGAREESGGNNKVGLAALENNLGKNVEVDGFTGGVKRAVADHFPGSATRAERKRSELTESAEASALKETGSSDGVAGDSTRPFAPRRSGTDTEIPGAVAAGTELEAGEENLGSNTAHILTSPSIGKETQESDGERKSKEDIPAKAPIGKYVPPGRQKIIDAKGFAGNNSSMANNASGMGPLWTSRPPVRVTQRARSSDRETSPARPAPARMARVVGGGMSAYGASISEYSEHMSREQVEACTAVISNFPAALPPGQRESMLQSFISLGALIVWPRPDEALATFATRALARQAVSFKANRSTVLVVELLSEARVDKRKAYRHVELARPGRPPSDASSASRLISGALGIRKPRVKPTGTTPVRKNASSSKGGIRGRGAKTAAAQPTESTDSWDM